MRLCGRYSYKLNPKHKVKQFKNFFIVFLWRNRKEEQKSFTVKEKNILLCRMSHEGSKRITIYNLKPSQYFLSLSIH